MLAAQVTENVRMFSVAILGGKLALLRKNHLIENPAQFDPVSRRMKAFIKAATGQIRELFRCLHHQRNGYLNVRFTLHHMMVKYKPMLIFDDADRQSKLLRNTGFALGNPFRVRFENGKQFFRVRDGLV